MYINKILMKFYHKSWFTHICRDFWKWQFHAFWGTFLNPQSLPGEHKGTFFMSGSSNNLRHNCRSVESDRSTELTKVLTIELTKVGLVRWVEGEALGS